MLTQTILGKVDSGIIDLKEYNTYLSRDDLVIVTVLSTGNTDISVAVSGVNDLN